MVDIIVIGARCAGSPVAMLLAKKGYRVLLVDRAHFPSDTLSTQHQVQLKGVAALQRWGLLPRLIGSNCPPARQVQFHFGPSIIRGEYPPYEGINAIYSPRRTILDKILVDAAVAAGAEVREDLLVEELVIEGERVTGIRGRVKAARGGEQQRIQERAKLVIGADGKHSLVARSVKASEYNQKPVLTCAYYTYWDGLDLTGGEMYSLPRSAVGIWPTNDGLAMIYTAYPAAEFPVVRQDIAGRFWKTMEALPGMAERLRCGKQADRFYGTADLPAFYRRPYGPGWALVGDAGMTLDPITGQGIDNAFLSAEWLAESIDAAFSGRACYEAAMAGFEENRNADTLARYEFTAGLASFQPPAVEQQALFEALAENRQAAGRFFGALSGSIPMEEFFSPANLLRIFGPFGMGKIFVGKIGRRRGKVGPDQDLEKAPAARM